MNSRANGASTTTTGFSPAAMSYAPQGLLRFLGPLDVVMLFAWVFSTGLLFNWSQPLRYIAAAYFLVSLVLFARQTLPTALRAWPTLIIPLFCIIACASSGVAPSHASNCVVANTRGVRFSSPGL